MITLPLIGRSISVFWKTVDYYGIRVGLNNPYMSSRNRAAVFWNIYESAEARLISTYLRKDLPVIELGASLGVISKLIGSNLRAKLVCIEANSSLLESIDFNLAQLSNLSYRIINKVLSYEGKPVQFAVNKGENLTGRVVKDDGIYVESVTLKQIIDSEGIKDFVLVMDIEGSEIEILLNDMQSLSNCKLLLMELHDIDYKGCHYSIASMTTLIEQGGFTLVKRDGNCFVYTR